jgi:hypothetical protein
MKVATRVLVPVMPLTPLTPDRLVVHKVFCATCNKDITAIVGRVPYRKVWCSIDCHDRYLSTMVKLAREVLGLGYKGFDGRRL